MNTWRPEAYHGGRKRTGYFEGWYFKVVDATESRRLAIIPGVFLAADPHESHAFVQTLDGVTGRTTYHRYPFDQFAAAADTFHIRIGPNQFARDFLLLDLNNHAQQLAGALRFTGLTPWPVTWRSPGIMDWYAFVPLMECYHGIVSLDHTIAGALIVDGHQIAFDGGRGYTEKDWGQAFPRAWIWMQSNHFAVPGVCLTASVARIPWVGSAFRGFIVGFWCDRQLYRFATYTGARITHLQISRSTVEWVIEGRSLHRGQHKQLRLALTAQRDGENVDLLHAPYRTAMLQRVLESLDATIEVELTDLTARTPAVLFSGQGRHAGLEIGGRIAEIL